MDHATVGQGLALSVELFGDAEQRAQFREGQAALVQMADALHEVVAQHPLVEPLEDARDGKWGKAALGVGVGLIPAAKAEKIAARLGKRFRFAKKPPIHHIATDKNLISAAAGGPYTPKFEAIFEKAGMTLQDGLNKLPIPGHRGPHPEYNRVVYERLASSVEGLNGASYQRALQKELQTIGTDSATPGSPLNRLLTGQ